MYYIKVYCSMQVQGLFRSVMDRVLLRSRLKSLNVLQIISWWQNSSQRRRQGFYSCCRLARGVLAHNGTGKQVGGHVALRKEEEEEVGGICDLNSSFGSKVNSIDLDPKKERKKEKQCRPSVVCRKSSLKLKKKVKEKGALKK